MITQKVKEDFLRSRSNLRVGFPAVAVLLAGELVGGEHAADGPRAALAVRVGVLRLGVDLVVAATGAVRLLLMLVVPTTG